MNPDQTDSRSSPDPFRALLTINALTSSEHLLTEGALSDSPGKAQEILQKVREVLDREAIGHAPYDLVLPQHSSREYVLPRELVELHPRLLNHFLSDLTNQALGFRGLLLHGTRGTGKTEYAQFLAHELGDRAQVVRVSVSNIRNAGAPGAIIESLYSELEREALRTGQYMVLLFDEGDQLFSPFAIQVEHSKTTTEAHSSEKRSSESTMHETTSRGEIDHIGLELLSAVKSVLGGRVSRVFTMVTSNRDNFPPEIYRDGRLKKIELKPFGMPDLKYLGPNQRYATALPIYDTYRDALPWTLAIMQAQEIRSSGNANPYLDAISEEVQAFFARQPPLETYRKASREVPAQHSGAPTSLPEFLFVNSTLLQELLVVLDYNVDLEKLYKARPMTFGFTDPTKEPNFCGFRLQNGHFMASWDHGGHGTAEVERLKELTPSIICGHYAESRTKYSELRSAKRTLGLFLFPQLQHLPANPPPRVS